MEETANTVKTSSDGTVKITVEKYQELLAAAEEKPPVVHRTVMRTPSVAAAENKMWGITMIGLGAALIVAGAVRFRVGVTQTSNL